MTFHESAVGVADGQVLIEVAIRAEFAREQQRNGRLAVRLIGKFADIGKPKSRTIRRLPPSIGSRWCGSCALLVGLVGLFCDRAQVNATGKADVGTPCPAGASKQPQQQAVSSDAQLEPRYCSP